VLATRLSRILAGGDVIALLTGDPAVAVALLTLRPNVWYDGPGALLDELYVAPELRGRGLGSALLAAAEAVTRQHGGELLEINVDGDDTGARTTCGAATSTASRARTSRSSTTTGNWETRRHSARGIGKSAGRSVYELPVTRRAL
jgi:GNAT superfamily N-acetyltransferase